MDLDGVRDGAPWQLHGQDDRGPVLVFDVEVAVHAAAGIPRGKLWPAIVAQSEEAQDDGLFDDEAGVKEWLATNYDDIMKEGQRRLQKAAAAYEKKKAAQDVITKARAAGQKAEARALPAANREAELVASLG
ncbi:hypothetical protein [Arthrobacter sp. NicSoilC12]|uniref:hypothetical protein n=1 Tax=Arthrobacter sp. NicSoilC12 TaxID=2831001 RepID=UPI001CC47466|nr:hypothetical protein [Arthrobacter sp. NicSoilC12]GIU57484.1 hypothetical protein NicSoilC12_32330 [Arthrobacter sp. NicSoilC12]